MIVNLQYDYCKHKTNSKPKCSDDLNLLNPNVAHAKMSKKTKRISHTEVQPPARRAYAPEGEHGVLKEK